LPWELQELIEQRLGSLLGPVMVFAVPNHKFARNEFPDSAPNV
jgi:hypothetical protein